MYVVKQADFVRLPRWPDDGLDRFAKRFLSGDAKHFPFVNPSSIHTALIELLGGWPCPTRFDELPPPGQEFWKAFPFTLQ